jgi:hypothetical protein
MDRMSRVGDLGEDLLRKVSGGSEDDRRTVSLKWES